MRGNGSRPSFRGSFHGGTFHGHGSVCGSSGHRTISPSPSLRDGGPSSEASANYHWSSTPMRKYNEIPERTPLVPTTIHACTARRARSSMANFMKVALYVRHLKPTERSKTTSYVRAAMVSGQGTKLHAYRSISKEEGTVSDRNIKRTFLCLPVCMISYLMYSIVWVMCSGAPSVCNFGYGADKNPCSSASSSAAVGASNLTPPAHHRCRHTKTRA